MTHQQANAILPPSGSTWETAISVSASAPAAAGRILSRNFILLIAGAFGFSTSLWLVMLYLPQLVLNLGGTESEIGLVLSAFAFTALLSRPIVGRLVDRFGCKAIALAGCVVFAVAPLLYAVAPSVPPLLAVRMFHGLGISLFGTAGMTWVAGMAPPARRAEAMGLYGNASQVAIALAPLLGGLFFDMGGFPLMFAAATVVGTGGVVFVGLAGEERHADNPAASAGSFRQALARPDVLAMTFALMAAAATWGSLTAFLPIYAAQRNAGPIAPFFTIYAIVTVILRLVVGPAADRLGRKTVGAPSLLLLAATMLAFNLLSSPFGLYALAAVYALSFGTIYPTMSAFLVDVVPAHVRGSAIGVLTAGFDLGIMLGAYVGGLVAERLGLGSAFVTAGVLCMAALVVFWAGTKEAPRG